MIKKTICYIPILLLTTGQWSPANETPITSSIKTTQTATESFDKKNHKKVSIKKLPWTFFKRHKGKVVFLSAIAAALIYRYFSHTHTGLSEVIHLSNRLLWGVDTRQGTREYMEDRHVTPVTFLDPSNHALEYTISAVFDGHGGDKAATLASKQLISTFNKTPGYGIKERLIKTFDDLNKTIINSGIKDGTTASVCLIVRDKSSGKKTLYTAHAGDSRISVKINHNTPWFSRDHKESDSMERKRLNENGISCEGGYARLSNGNGLNVTRGLGDKIFKEASPQGFISTPDVKEFDITGKTAAIIIGSDGLYDALEKWQKPFEDILRDMQQYTSQEQMTNAAQKLTNLADMHNKTLEQFTHRNKAGTARTVSGQSDNITALPIVVPANP